MFIYKTTNLINGKYYIGKYAGNRSTYLGSGIALRKALIKYGRSNFKRVILEVCNTLQELSDREKYWIELFDAVNDPRSYNLTEGGHGGFTHVTEAHYVEKFNKRYGKKLERPVNAVSSDYIQEYVVEVDGIPNVITGMKNASEYLGMDCSQVYTYLGIDVPRKGYKFKSLLVDTYTHFYYLIDGKKYTDSKDICQEYGVTPAVLHHRCLKSERINWWKIVEVKDKWKKL